jgi:transposase
MVVALAIVAAIGDVGRFEQSQKLVSYLGLNPSVRQSGRGPAYHGRITKQGRGHVRGMLVEAAWAAARAPGPLRAFFLRVGARRGQHVAAVATARKLAVLIGHLLSKGESYVWARRALHARKLRDLELKAGYKAARGKRGAAHAYNIKSHRDQGRRWVEQAETAYARFVSGWNPRGGPKRVRTGAATEVRRCVRPIRIGAEDLVSQAVDPVNLLLLNIPDRPFAERRLAVDDRTHVHIVLQALGCREGAGRQNDGRLVALVCVLRSANERRVQADFRRVRRVD